MKRKEDDLAKLDGKAVPTWAKILAFCLAFAVSFTIFYFFQRMN